MNKKEIHMRKINREMEEVQHKMEKKRKELEVLNDEYNKLLKQMFKL